MSALFSLIFGPTASGKTAWALERAKQTGAWILAADSRQVYLGMDIVSGKDIPEGYTPETWTSPEGTLPVYKKDDSSPLLFGFDFVRPNQDFSVSHFSRAVEPLIRFCRQEKQHLIIVGGTWQYLEVLISPPASLFISPVASLREQLSQLTVAELQERLKETDLAAWSRLNDSDRSNPRRLVRALEIAQQAPLLDPPTPLLYPGEYEILLREKTLAELEPLLRQRIELRLQMGALEETRRLLEQYTDWNFPAFTATGYRELARTISGEITLEEAKENWWRQERQYAKRQLTWLKKVRSEYLCAEA